MEEKIYDTLVSSITRELIKASTHLEDSLVEAIKEMKRTYEKAVEQSEPSSKEYKQQEASLLVLTMILKNLDIAADKQIPMCQDTGMLVAFADIGPDTPLTIHEIEKVITVGALDAFDKGHFRHSVVDDPLFKRKNTQTNLPFVFHITPQKSGTLSLHFLLKGFGSENCSAMKMLNPTATKDDVMEAVYEMVMAAGGKPCPPIVVGVGLGGTADMSAVLAKRALVREVGTHHPHPQYEELEKDLLLKLQTTHIGPGGFGGPLTALFVSVEYMATHIAGLPVSVAISCWADRKAHVYL